MRRPLPVPRPRRRDRVPRRPMQTRKAERLSIDSGNAAGAPAPLHWVPGRSGPAHGRPALLPLGAVLPAWCDQIPTPAENQLYPYSGHSCAHRHPHDFGKLFIEGRQITETGAVMSIIPLDLQRRCERRWAARFSRPIPSAAPRNQRPVRESLQIAAPAKSKEKPAGLKRQA